MNIVEPILKFLHGGFKEAFNSEDKQQPLVVIDQKGGYGANTMPYVMPVVQPNVYALPHNMFLQTQPVRFGVTFEPMDDETFEDLDEDQPVVVFIYDPYEPEEFIYVVTELGQGINNGELYPGTYALVALVYLDEDFDDIDGVGTATFNIYEGELPFDLTVPISSDDEDISDFLDEIYGQN